MVSMVAVWGRAVVMVVSMPPSCRASCAKKFALRGLMVGVSAKKFALHAQNTPKSAFLRLLGEFFRGSAAGGASLGEFFRGIVTVGAVLGELCRAVGLAAEPFYWRPAGARAPDNRPPHAPPLTFVMAPPASKGTSGPT